MTTQMIPVNSSQISYIGFDDENNKLYVTFNRTNKTYEYSDVPYIIWKDFKESTSIGSYFSKNIKNTYKYREI